MFATLTLIADRGIFDTPDELDPPAVAAETPARSPSPTDPDQFEHDTRCLLNLIGLLSHCLRNDMFPEEERRRWRRELAEAEEKLGRLRRAA